MQGLIVFSLMTIFGFGFSFFGFGVGSNTSEGFCLEQPQPALDLKMVLRMFFLLEDIREREECKPFALYNNDWER